MKKMRMTAVAAGLLAVLVIGAAAAAAVGGRDVTARLRPDVTVKLDGVAQTMVDARGKALYPIQYEGNTYLPVRAMGDLTGREVAWDGETQTVLVGSGRSEAAGDVIGEAQAKEIALADAGVKASQVTFIKLKLDWEDGRRVYEVEFYSGNTEYDYDVDAYTGEIRGFDYDVEHYSIPQSGPYISREEAGRLAQDRAPGATLVKLELDCDDGRAVYEGELRDGRYEYEFEIDAVTGGFLQWEQDWDD